MERERQPGEKREVARRLFINAKSQLVWVTLVEETENPDGIFYMQSFQETSPPPPGTHRPFGRLKRLPDEEIKVKIVEGIVINENPGLEDIERVTELWNDFAPIAKAE